MDALFPITELAMIAVFFAAISVAGVLAVTPGRRSRSPA